jgi:hypothetical protein
VEALVLAVVLALTWKALRPWPSVPLADPDTWGYLSPALHWLGGQGFRQTDGRDWLYPALVTLFIKTTGTLNGIVTWQKCFHFLAGIAMAVTWRCWVSMLPFRRGVQLLVSILGAWPIYVNLVNQQNIFFAVSIRPESVLPFFVDVQLACLMGYAKYRWQQPRPVTSLTLGAAAVVFAYACLVLKPSWYFGTVMTALPIFAGVFGKSFPAKTRFLTPIAGLAGALLLLWLPGRVLMVHDSSSVTLLPDALLCVHAQFIDNYLEDKLAHMADSDPEKARLKTFVTVLESELFKARHAHKTYEKLGFDADYLMHDETLSTAIYSYTGNDRKKFSAFCFGCYWAAIAHDPRGYVWKICDQFGHFLFPEPRTFFGDQQNLPKAYQGSADNWFASGAVSLSPEMQELYGRYRDDTMIEISHTKTLEKDLKLRAFRQYLSTAALPLTLILLLALTATHLWPPLHLLRQFGWATLFLYFAPFGNAFGVCVVHTLDIFRYRITYGGYLLFAFAAMAVFILMVAWQSALSLRVVKVKTAKA